MSINKVKQELLNYNLEELKDAILTISTSSLNKQLEEVGPQFEEVKNTLFSLTDKLIALDKNWSQLSKKIKNELTEDEQIPHVFDSIRNHNDNFTDLLSMVHRLNNTWKNREEYLKKVLKD
jgi:archaellum component FlaC